MPDERGPSWNDCGQLMRDLVKRGYRAPTVRLVPNWRFDDRTANVSWCCVVSLDRSRQDQGSEVYAQETFASRNGWKTAPSALYAALTSCIAQLDAREKAALAQATF